MRLATIMLRGIAAFVAALAAYKGDWRVCAECLIVALILQWQIQDSAK